MAKGTPVLILVLLGCGLLGVQKQLDKLFEDGLNPCFVGMWSFSIACNGATSKSQNGLNPCFVGMWSFRLTQSPILMVLLNVLILVLLGCGLLVTLAFFDTDSFCLNPCFVGMWSFRRRRRIEESRRGRS